MSVLEKMARVTLGDAFDIREGRRVALGKSLAEQTKQIKSEILNKRSEANIAEVQTALNNIFYPKNNTSMINREELKQNMVNEMINTMISKIHSAAASASQMTDSAFKSAYSGNENATGFQLQRISSMITQVESRLVQFQKTVDTQNLLQIQAGVEQMKILQNDLLSLVSQYASSEKSTIHYNKLSPSVCSQVMPLLKTIYLLYEAIDNKLTVQDWQVFERALAEVKRLLTNNTSEELTQSIIKSLTGSQVVSRGSGNTQITVSSNAAAASLKNQAGFKMQGSKVVVEFIPFSAKQGKMDVLADWQQFYGGTKNSYRTSAKSWSRGRSKWGLGTTSIMNAIARSAGGISAVDRYALGLLRTKDQFHWVEGLPPTVALHEAHRMAKISLLADISMGLSQKANYANLLIIDTGKSIQVYDLAGMIEKYLKGQEDLFEFIGYNESTIESAMADIYNNNIRRLGRTKTDLRTNTYFGLARAKLNTMKVTIRPNF